MFTARWMQILDGPADHLRGRVAEKLSAPRFQLVTMPVSFFPMIASSED